MPDSIGRYKFSEMALIIRRKLNAVRVSVDPVTGQELSVTITNQLISNNDILTKLNSAQVGIYSDMFLRRPEIFESDRFIDIQANVIDYAFPLGMIQFSAMLAKSQTITPTSIPPLEPSDYVEMICIDDPHDVDEVRGVHAAPTWRRIGDSFQLNTIPQQANAQGIMVRGVFLPGPIVNDLASPPPPPSTTMVQGPVPTVVQELLVIEAARDLSQEKMMQEPANIAEDLALWRARLDTVVVNIQAPRSVQIVTDGVIKQTYSGRNGRGGRTVRTGW